MTAAPETPHSVEAEENLLSCCFLDGAETLQRCLAAKLDPSSFYFPAHGIIFNAGVSLASRGLPVDVATIAEELGTHGRLDGIGGYPFLAQVSQRLPTTAHVDFFIKKVSDLAKQRRLQTNLNIAREAANGLGTWEDVWAAVEPPLRKAADASASATLRSLEAMAAQAISWRLTPNLRPTTPTPWPAWDRSAGAPRSGELIVIAGRPGTGKTTLAGCIAHDVARSGKVAAFFSLEMSGEEIVDRFAARLAGRAGLGSDQRANAAVAEQLKEIGGLRTLRIFEQEDASTLSQIEASCRLMASAPAGLSAIVVDYLQLVTPPSETKREMREQQVAAMSRRFKLLARSVGCPVFLCAQLNRESEKDERRPRMSDLRESGAIEQDADRCWLLYRPKPTAGQPLPPADAAEIEVALYQAKCRNGPAGIEAFMRFHRATFNFIYE